MPGRTIVAISGGKSSAWCAKWASEDRDSPLLYFNDTKWEHKDLYRFLDDISESLGLPILKDSDGRTPEQLFYDQRALANNRMPFCSRILKAERLQNFVQDGDELVFGIGANEEHRALRIAQVYQLVSAKKGISLSIRFPLIEDGIESGEVDRWLESEKIDQPYLYSIGFTHNNCSGGCVRAGKLQWKLLLDNLPEVYDERERVEREVGIFLGKEVTYLKDISLERFRKKAESGELSDRYYIGENFQGECMGICSMF